MHGLRRLDKAVTNIHYVLRIVNRVIKVLPTGHLRISHRSRPIKFGNMGINLAHKGQSGQYRSAIYQPVPLLFGGGCWLYSVAFLRAHCIYSAVVMPV
jgi:hypothetical protein